MNWKSFPVEFSQLVEYNGIRWKTKIIIKLLQIPLIFANVCSIIIIQKNEREFAIWKGWLLMKELQDLIIYYVRKITNTRILNRLLQITRDLSKGE